MLTLNIEKTFDVVTADKAIQERLEERGAQVVMVQDAKKALTYLQRRTYFMWIGDMEKQTGETKDEIHLFYKDLFLKPIYYRDDPGYHEMANALGEVRKDHPELFEKLKRGVLEMTSITDASTKQMFEYMEGVQRHAHIERKITLRMPEDLRSGIVK